MRLLILGGGSCQLNAIIKAKEMGHEVVVTDYYIDAPGKKYADFSEIASTFDIEAVYEVAKKNLVDGILTLGTDQPVYTCARIAEMLSLPSLISSKTAKAATNKEIMKNIMSSHNIPTTRYTFISENFEEKNLNDFVFPIVMKPLDSQGQRGVFKLDSIEKIKNHIKKTLSFSREDKVLIEEYYESDEITVSGWVHKGQLSIMTVTDRLTFEKPPIIGISYGHNFPTKYFDEYYNKIENISNDIVNAFEIKDGPIYFQMLIGKDGIKVNEIACRIGGAFEDELIPLVTGIDILEILIHTSLNQEYDTEKLSRYNIKNNTHYASVQLFFARQGKIKDITPFTQLKKLNYFINGKHNYTVGNEISEIENAAQRAGYMIIKGSNKQNLENNIHNAFKHIKILDTNKNNLIIPYSLYRNK